MVPEREPDGLFELCPRLPGCSACHERAAAQAAPVDAVYCISLQEEQKRTQQAVAHFHAIGLCRQVTFYRPRRGNNVDAATWASHRDVARHALAHDRRRVLVLEDDVNFSSDWRAVAARTARAMTRLPAGWWGFYLGHWPVQAYFVARDVLRVRSTCTHAYIANRPLIEWLARSQPLDAAVPTLWLGPAVDTAMANLPEMYALFPMAATQRPPAEYRHDPRLKADGASAGWMSFSRHRYWIIHRAMRLAEAAAVLLSPLHWASMRLRGIGSGQPGRVETGLSRAALLVQQSGLFDHAYYLAQYPDVERAGVDPLHHYLRHGDREGRMPHPLFDVAHYRRSLAQPLRRADNSLLHYLRAEAAVRGSPHPCFDEAWYLARNPDAAAANEPGLAHYLRRGWKDGRWPHPEFDPERYGAEHPDVDQTGMSALEHHVRSRQEAKGNSEKS